MKPAHAHFGYTTFDLTEVKTHVLDNEDGSQRVVGFVPKTWTKGERVGITTHDGSKQVDVCPYVVTEWTEVLIATIPKPG